MKNRKQKIVRLSLIVLISLVGLRACSCDWGFDFYEASALAALLTPAPADESETEEVRCSNDIKNPVQIVDIRLATVQAGDHCYFRLSDETKTILQLSPTDGDADLYAAFTDDDTGGEIDSEDCDVDTAGGGWEYCSRTRGNTPENIELDGLDGESRIIAVYGKDTEAIKFKLTATVKTDDT